MAMALQSFHLRCKEERKSLTKMCCSERVLNWRVSLTTKVADLSLCILSIFVLFCLSRLVVLVWAVRQTVPSQVTVAPKHLSAAATAVGLDVCMGEKVSFQVTSLIKGSSACGAFVGRLLFRFKARKGLFPFNCIESLSVVSFSHLHKPNMSQLLLLELHNMFIAFASLIFMF